MVVYQKLCKESGSERGRGEEQLELRGLVLQAVAHLERAPGKTNVLDFSPDFAVAHQFVFSFAHFHQRVFPNPVDILYSPFAGIFFVARRAVGFPHRSEPFVAVQLPAKLVILYRPVLPVDVFPVVVRRLVALVYEERMFHRVVRPFLLFLADADMLQVDVRCSHVRPLAVIAEQRFRRFFVFPLFVESFHFFKAGTFEVEQSEYLASQFLPADVARAAGNHP